jgi:transposase
VARVVVVNPSQFKVISQSVKKTDRTDAETLALYLAKGLLPEVRMKERQPREMSHLAQTGDLLVKQRSVLKTKLHNILAAEGINLKKEALSSNKALQHVLALSLPPVLAAETRVFVAQIRSLSGSIAELEELIEEEGSKLAGHENLMSIKGIGPVSATVLLRTIGNIEDFADPGKLAAYLGLVPRVANSNETEHCGRIPKQGNKPRGPRSCNALWSPSATAGTCNSSSNASSGGAVAAKPISRWHANFWESSITLLRTTGCSMTSPTLFWPPENRLKRKHE